MIFHVAVRAFAITGWLWAVQPDTKSAVAQLSCSNFGSTDVSYNHLKRKDRVVLSFNMVLQIF